MIIGGIVLAVVVISFFMIMNKINKLKVKVDEAKSGIDIALGKRYDILTESLNVVKGYSKHESEVLIQLTQVRGGMTLDDTKAVIANQESVMEKMRMVGEAYPQLYSNELYKKLQDQIEDTNEHLAAAKRLFNANIARYNQSIVTFPACIVAGCIGHHQMTFLQETNPDKVQDVHLTF